MRQSLKRDRKTPGSAVVIDDAVERPLLSPVSGQYDDSVEVTITCATALADVYYETDGSTPTSASTLYSAPFTLNTVGTHDVKAIGIKAGLLDSAIGGATYVIVDSTPPPSGFDSHPPHLETPETADLVGRADAAPATVYYMDPAGDDVNAGTIGSPIRTLHRAAELMGPGDTLFLRAGHHFLAGNDGVFAASGTASQPIYIRGYPNERAYLNFGIQEFWDDAANAWEAVADGIPDHYRSVSQFDRGADAAINRRVYGYFGDSFLPLGHYGQDIDFAATNEFNIPCVEVDPGPPPVLEGSASACHTVGTWFGPGTFWDFDDKRIHIRLSHTNVPVLDTYDYLGSGFSANYTGETDPRNLQLCIPHGEEVGFKIDGAYVICQDFVVLGSDNTRLNEIGNTGNQYHSVWFYATWNGGGVNVRGDDIHLERCKFRGPAAPWQNRFHYKRRTNAVGLLNMQLCVTFRVTRCEFTDFHDGGPTVWGEATLDGQIDRCLIYNHNDDGVYLPYRRNTNVQIRLFLNIFRCGLSTLPTQEAPPGERGSQEVGGGTTIPAPADSGVYIYRNLFDKRLKSYYRLPDDTDTTNEVVAFNQGPILQNHGPCEFPNWFFYHNTMLTHEKFRRYMGLAEFYVGSTRTVYNNILRGRDLQSNQISVETPGTFTSRNNCDWSDAGASSTQTGDITQNPLFVDMDLSDIAHSDVRLTPSSPCIGAAFAIPATWPDVSGFSQADIGAIPFGESDDIFGPDSEVEG